MQSYTKVRHIVAVFLLFVIAATFACSSTATDERPRGIGNAGTVTSVYEIAEADVLRDHSDWDWQRFETWKTDNFEIGDPGLFRYSYQGDAKLVSVDSVVVIETDEIVMFFYKEADGKLYMHTEIIPAD